MAFEFDKMSINGTIINAKDLEGRDLITQAKTTAENAVSIANEAAETANTALLNSAALQGDIDALEASDVEIRNTYKTKAEFPVFVGSGPNSGQSNTITFDLSDYLTVGGMYAICTLGAIAFIRRSGTTYTLMSYSMSGSTATTLADSTITMYTGSYSHQPKIYRIA